MLPHLSLLSDLIQSEIAYANDLFIIIKRIAAAYSPQNFPPPHLDIHFRLIELIFRASKSFLSNSLLPINPPPPSLDINALAAILLDWLALLIPQYNRYLATWAPKTDWNNDLHVKNNPSLIHTLALLPWPASIPKPPAQIFPDAPYSPADTISPGHDGPHASLTVFFALPFARLVYYRRLYSDLHALLPPPTPEHGLISDAGHQIALLVERGSAQWTLQPRPSSHLPPIAHPDPPPLLVQNAPQPPTLDPPAHQTDTANLRSSTDTSLSAQAHSSSASVTDEVFDRTTPSTPLSSSSAASDGLQAHKNQPMVEVARGIFVQQEILDLERLLDTSRCLDIFTMTPKQCRLQLAPPSLMHSRTIRLSGEARFLIRPHADPTRELATANGRLILITDLLIFCEHMGPEARGEKKMWLVYPPLAGKHLRVAPSPADETEFEVLIMAKEAVRVTVASRAERDGWVHALEDAIEYGRQQPTQLQASMLRLDSRAPPRSASAHSSPSGPSLSQVACQPRDGFRSQPLSPCSPLGHHNRSPTPVAHPLPAPPAGFHPGHQRSLSAQRLIHSAGPHPHPHDLPPSGPDHRGPWSAHSSHPHHLPLGSSDGRPPRSAGPPIDLHARPPRPGAPPVKMLRKMPSAHSLSTPRAALTDGLPPMPTTHAPQGGWAREDAGRLRSDRLLSPTTDQAPIRRVMSTEPVREQQYRPPSTAVSHQRMSAHARRASSSGSSIDDREQQVVTESILAATMRTKVFLKTSHSQWKALGSGKLHVFIQRPGNKKQLVVVGEEKGGKTIISTIVESDGVERVGRAGVAVELCGVGTQGLVGGAGGGGGGGAGGKTGIVYMLQMKNETSAVGLFEQLLEGSDRRLRAS